MNKELINIESKEGQLVVTSREVAENFEKRHSHVCETIRNLTAENSEVKNMIIESSYEHRGNEYTEYLLTRDGFSLLVMGFTGSKALTWKLKYIEAFNKMEQVLKEPKQLSPMEQLKLQYQVLEEHEVRFKNIEDRLDSMEVNPSQRKAIQDARNARVTELIGKKTTAYMDRSFRSKVYADIGKQYNRYFDIPSYELTPKNRYYEAIELIKSYNLSAELNMELKKLNNQISYL